jgi:hypothetical protein
MLFEQSNHHNNEKREAMQMANHDEDFDPPRIMLVKQVGTVVRRPVSSEFLHFARKYLCGGSGFRSAYHIS